MVDVGHESLGFGVECRREIEQVVGAQSLPVERRGARGEWLRLHEQPPEVSKDLLWGRAEALA
jgi:hypothetical protein